MGREVVPAITNGRLDFGTWERIFYGQRVLVKIIVAAGLLCGLLCNRHRDRDQFDHF
jgi:hypothetical protein